VLGAALGIQGTGRAGGGFSGGQREDDGVNTLVGGVTVVLLDAEELAAAPNAGGARPPQSPMAGGCELPGA
jgi:hypothetical protein